MKNNILLRTNLFVCAVIVLGFIITSVTSYHSNRGIFERDVERVSSLTSEGIYYQVDSIFTKPINISLTMANDSLLKDFLSEEEQRLGDESFLANMRNYLLAYKEKYNYDSVFLVSTNTNRYYHFHGVDRVIQPDDPKDVWYYTLLESNDEYRVDIDDDKAANGEITIFINCKIKSSTGDIMGIVGVGFRVNYMQKLFQEYENRFDVQAYLIDKNGTITISTDKTGFQAVNLFANCGYTESKEKILSNKESTESFWYSSQRGKGFIVAKYIPNLEWHLIIDNDTSALNQKLNRQFFEGILVIFGVIVLVLILITRIIRKYNAQIVQLTVDKEKEHRTIFQLATEKLYENIYELDITHNCAASEATKLYFESLGVPKDTPYDKALQLIAEKQIKAEYRQGYVDTFSPDHVLKAYQDGLESLHYDFMITNDDGYTYYWMRITARIFYWKEDQSIRMFTYRQNIDAEKQQEKHMVEKMERDSLTGLYNKASTQEHIQTLLLENPEKSFAFFILDIDDFKRINDTYGHATGDLVIADFAKMLKEQFRAEDIVGRIGGDEFVVFISVPSREWVEIKAQSLVLALHHECMDRANRCKISASIGIAIAPESGTDFETLYKNADTALYCIKEKGKNGFAIDSHF